MKIEQGSETFLAGRREDVSLGQEADAAQFAAFEQQTELGGADADGEPGFTGDILFFLQPGAHGNQHELGSRGERIAVEAGEEAAGKVNSLHDGEF